MYYHTIRDLKIPQYFTTYCAEITEEQPLSKKFELAESQLDWIKNEANAENLLNVGGCQKE